MGMKRQSELRAILMAKRGAVAGDIKERLAANRDENTQRRGDRVRDFAEDSVVSMSEDVELQLLQLKTETLAKIDQALGRLTQGLYGYCAECGEGIAEARLRALPFALRCKDCEEAREDAERRERELARRQGSTSVLFGDRGPQLDSR